MEKSNPEEAQHRALMEGIENLDRRPVEIEQLIALQAAIFSGEFQGDEELRLASEAYRKDLLSQAVAIQTQLESEYTQAEEMAQLDREESTEGIEIGESDFAQTVSSSDLDAGVEKAERRLRHFESLVEELEAIDFSGQADLGVGLEELSGLLPEFHAYEVDWLFSQVGEQFQEVEAIAPKHSKVVEFKAKLGMLADRETISAQDYHEILAELESVALWVSVEERIQLYSEMLDSAAMTDAIINGAGLWETGLNLAPEYHLAQTEYIRAHRLLTEGKYQEARELFVQLEQAPENLSLLENYQNSQRVNQCTISAGIVIASAGAGAIAAELAGGAVAYLGGGAKLIQGVRFATNAAGFTLAHRRLETLVHGREFFDPKLSAAENALQLAEETALNAGMFAFLGKSQKLYAQLVNRGVQRIAQQRLAFHSYLRGKPLGLEVQKVFEKEITATFSTLLKAGSFSTELVAFSAWDFLATNYQMAKKGDFDPVQAWKLAMTGPAIEENLVFLLALKAGGVLAAPITRPIHQSAQRWAMARYQTRFDAVSRGVEDCATELESYLKADVRKPTRLIDLLSAYENALKEKKAFLEEIPGLYDPNGYALTEQMIGTAPHEPHSANTQLRVLEQISSAGPRGPLMVFGTFWGLWKLFQRSVPISAEPSERPARKIGERLRRQVDAALRDRSGEGQPTLILDAQTGKILNYPDSPNGVLRLTLQHEAGSGRWFLTDESFQGLVGSYRLFKDPQRRVILEVAMRLGHLDQVKSALAEIRGEDVKSMLSGAFPLLPEDFPKEALPKLTHPEVRKTRHWKTLDAQSTQSPTRFNVSPFYDVLANMEGHHQGPGMLFKVAPQENRPANELLEVYLHVGEYLALMPADTPDGKKPKVVIYATLPAKSHPFRRGDLVDLRFTDSSKPSGPVDPAAFGMPLMIFDPRSLWMRGLKKLWEKLLGGAPAREAQALPPMNDELVALVRERAMDPEAEARERQEALLVYGRLLRERYIGDEEVLQALQDFRGLLKEPKVVGKELLDTYWALIGRIPEGHEEAYAGAKALREFYGSRLATPVLAEKAAMIYWSIANLLTAGDPRVYAEAKALRSLVVNVRAGWQMMSNYSVLAKKFGKEEDLLKEEALGLQQIAASPLHSPVLRHEAEAALKTLLTLLPGFDPAEPQLFTVFDKAGTRGVKYLLEADPKTVPNPKKLWAVMKISRDQIILRPYSTSEGDKTVPLVYLLYFGNPPRFREGAAVEMIPAISGGVDLDIDPPFIEGEPLLGITERGEPYYLFHKDGRLSHRHAISVKVDGLDLKRNWMLLGVVDPKQAVRYGTEMLFNYSGDNPYRLGQRLMLIRPVRGASGTSEDLPPGGHWLWITAQNGESYELRRLSVRDAQADGLNAVILQAKQVASPGGDIYRHAKAAVQVTLGYGSSMRKLIEGLFKGALLEQVVVVLDPESAEKMGIEFDSEGKLKEDRLKSSHFTLRPREDSTDWTPLISDSEAVLTKVNTRSYVLKLTDQVTELILGRGEGAFGHGLFQYDRTISRRHLRITRDDLGRFEVENLSKTHLLQIDMRQAGRPPAPVFLTFGKMAFIEGNEVLYLGKARVHLYYEPS